LQPRPYDRGGCISGHAARLAGMLEREVWIELVRRLQPRPYDREACISGHAVPCAQNRADRWPGGFWIDMACDSAARCFGTAPIFEIWCKNAPRRPENRRRGSMWCIFAPESSNWARIGWIWCKNAPRGPENRRRGLDVVHICTKIAEFGAGWLDMVQNAPHRLENRRRGLMWCIFALALHQTSHQES